MIGSILKHKYEVFVILILLGAIFLRFVNYENRWGLAYDQAHDFIVAKYALQEGKIPLVGPFASGAQFQTSGIWYWFLMGAISLFPFVFITPWVVITLAYVFFVLFMMLIGKELVNEKFGLLVGILAAVSSAQITQATNLTLTAPMSFITAVYIFSVIKFIKTKKKIFLFILGLSLGLSPVMHLSGLLLLVALPISILILRVRKIGDLSLIFLGLIIPAIPLVIFDLKNNFVNISGLLNHLFFKQYQVTYEVLGRRWLTYSAIFWPKAWANIVGGSIYISYLILAALFWSIISGTFLKKINIAWGIFASSFLLIIIAMRYVRSPLFDSYLVFLHPFVLLFSSISIYWLMKKKLIAGVLLLVFVVTGSLHQDYYEITKATNYTYDNVKKVEGKLLETGAEKFSVYNYSGRTANLGLPLVLLLYQNNRIDEKGLKIGVYDMENEQTKGEVLVGKNYGINIISLQSSTAAQLQKTDWMSINPSEVYKKTEEWY